MLVTTKHSRRSRTVTHEECPASASPIRSTHPPGSAGSMTNVPTIISTSDRNASSAGST